MSDGRHPVDQIPSLPQLVPLSLQHVLVMYAGAVAVPLIIGRALKLPPEQVAFLISADVFAGGLATLVQSFGLPFVGIRLPVMMGVTFASVGGLGRAECLFFNSIGSTEAAASEAAATAAAADHA